MFRNGVVVVALLGVGIFAAGKASAQNTGPTFLPSPEQQSAVADFRNREQSGVSEEDLQLLRKDLRLQKKQIVAANMTLTDAQEEKFWRIYDQYSAELVRINDKKVALIQEYSQDDDSESYFKGRAALEDSIMQLKLRYIPIFREVLSVKETALFFRLDWRLSEMIDLQIEPMPLTQP